MAKYIVTFLAILFCIAFFIKGCGNNSEYEQYPLEPTEISEVIDTLEQNLDTCSNIVFSETYISDIEIPRICNNIAEQILIRTGYTCSYNQDTRNANWVAWHLSKEHTDGPWSRKGLPYIEDSDVIGAKQELSDWYNHNLNIDHGHLCPAGDNKWDKDAMIESFLLTHMCPQNSNLNQGIWETLESRCRGWARHYGEIYIVAGPIFYNSYKTIGANKVGVPDAFYKVILCLVDEPKALGFIFQNEIPEYNSIKDYMCSVDEVEKITQIDFFYNLEDSIENKVEAVSNLHIW